MADARIGQRERVDWRDSAGVGLFEQFSGENSGRFAAGGSPPEALSQSFVRIPRVYPSQGSAEDAAGPRSAMSF